ncbi:LRR domain containing protein [Parasponia andersonii]|uniref:LRR domain containing protein n=1 Tax=Parasponia andersonii TaxID=3476 RepID=A0A2P5C3M3_PARAD|nr:LRR domain containing protein [Parasponia andersonii]
MKLVDLAMLEHLQGFLCVRGIGNIEAAGEVEKAKLRNKQSLTDLKLNFSQDTEPHKTEHELEVLLEAFQPPPNLKYLQISTYNGATFPNWMVSLVNLRCLTLFSCANCEFLPPLGRLPSLEILHMFHMDKVEEVGHEFLGVETGRKALGLATISPHVAALRLKLWWEFQSLFCSHDKVKHQVVQYCLMIQP